MKSISCKFNTPNQMYIFHILTKVIRQPFIHFIEKTMNFFCKSTSLYIDRPPHYFHLGIMSDDCAVVSLFVRIV